jgi:hypothetical protein
MGREKASWPSLKTVPWPPDHAGPVGGAATEGRARTRQRRARMGVRRELAFDVFGWDVGDAAAEGGGEFAGFDSDVF